MCTKHHGGRRSPSRSCYGHGNPACLAVVLQGLCCSVACAGAGGWGVATAQAPGFRPSQMLVLQGSYLIQPSQPTPPPAKQQPPTPAAPEQQTTDKSTRSGSSTVSAVAWLQGSPASRGKEPSFPVPFDVLMRHTLQHQSTHGMWQSHLACCGCDVTARPRGSLALVGATHLCAGRLCRTCASLCCSWFAGVGWSWQCACHLPSVHL